MQKFLIAPFQSGLQKNQEPWLIQDDAYELLENMYVFRGRLKKRFGTLWTGAAGQRSSRLRIEVDTTDGSGDAAGTVPSAAGAIGQAFSIDDQMYYVSATGTPANLLHSSGATTASFNTSTGTYSFIGAPASKKVYFYPALPVMGIWHHEIDKINNQPAFVFDTKYVYKWNNAWERDDTRGVVGQEVVWKGDNTNFFWATNHRGTLDSDATLFVTNFNATEGGPGANDDPIWYRLESDSSWYPLDDVTAGPTRSFVFNTTDNTGAATARADGRYVKTARIIVPFKNRLVLLNTYENSGQTTGASSTNNINTHHQNRARFSHAGSPFSDNAWYESKIRDTANNKADGGGWVDAPAQEEIISAAFIRDRLIVYFEESTWELVYTGNYIKPFAWQQLNSELGSQSQFSTVPFDKQVITVGNVGVHACTGTGVQRIDEKIPDEIFTVKNQNSGVRRVAGVRDYKNEMVYWSLPTTDAVELTYPEKVLVYNYNNGSWPTNNDCITAYGYFEESIDLTWADADMTWDEADFTWIGNLRQAEARLTIGGNQEGYMFIIDADIATNAPLMQLTSLDTATGDLTIVDHTLQPGEYIALEGVTGITFTGDPYYEVQSVDVTAHTVTVDFDDTASGTYTGGGTVRRVSQPRAVTKQFNPFVEQGKNFALAQVDFYVDRTSNGELFIGYYRSSSDYGLVGPGTATGMLLGTSILETYPYDLYPFEQVQEKLWHTLYLQAAGENIQLDITLNDRQMRTANITDASITINGMLLQGQPAGRLE